MKALSLWQPWASLVALGSKKIETRSWATSHRGPIAIHAAKKWNRELVDMCLYEPFASELGKLRPNEGGMFYLQDALPKILPFGCIVAVADLVDCFRIDGPPDDALERLFGDYRPGRFGWRLDNVRPIANVPCVGRQGLFHVNGDIDLEVALCTI